MIVMVRNKKWRNLTAREKAPLVLRGIVQFALLAAALVSIHRRRAEEINGSKWLWSGVALVNFMGIGLIASLFPVRTQARRAMNRPHGRRERTIVRQRCLRGLRRQA